MNPSLLMLGLVLLAVCEGEFIAKYFIQKNVKVLNVFLCDKEAARQTARRLINDKNLLANVGIRNGKKVHFGSARLFAQGIYMDLNCVENKELLFKQTNINSFNTSFAWLLSADRIEILGELASLPLGVNSDVVLRLPSGDLYDVYKIAPQYRLQTDVCGTLGETEFRLAKRKRSNFDGVTLIGALLITELKLDDDYQNVSRQLVDPTYFPEFDIYNRQHFIFHGFLQKWLNYK